MKKKYTFVLNFGYVESSRLSFMPFTSAEKYADAKEALVDLASFLKERYLERHKITPKKCCTASKQKAEPGEYCSKCGRSLKEEEFNEEHFIDYLRSMSDCDIDTFHSDIMDWDPDYRWQSEGLEGQVNQRFVYQAEWVLAAAIGYPHREDNTFEDICKKRTKNKTESFTYY